MRIEKYCGLTVNLGNYESLRLGLTIKLDREIKSERALEKASGDLLRMAKRVLDREVAKIREARDEEQGR